MIKFESVGRVAAPLARDAAGLGGLGLIVGGVSRWSVPAAMIVAGLLCVGLAVLWARKS